MVRQGIARILGAALSGDDSLVPDSGRALAVQIASPSPESSVATAAVIALTAALAIALLALVRLTHSRRKTAAATHSLAALAHRLKSGEQPEWTPTGVAEVDDIARTLEEFEERLRRKRPLLTRLSNELIRSGGGAGSNGFNNQLRAIIDALPVGVLLAEAPIGRILAGNKALEAIQRGPIVYSESVDQYQHWTAVHESGEPVTREEYPLTRALAGEERPVLECRHQRADGSWGWISIVGSPIRGERGEIIAAIVAVTDIDEIKSAEEHRRSMDLELHHRVNNSLAMIQGIANITARTAKDFACFRNSFNDRIHCLSRLSTLLVKKSWSETPMKDLVTTALACDGGALRENIRVSGDDVELRSEVALALGMALHELLSNAQRHGALSAEQGQIAIDWRVVDSEGHRLRVDWKEHGGPPVASPQHTGVGQHLMTVLSRQFGGDIDIFFEPDGVRATLTAEI